MFSEERHKRKKYIYLTPFLTDASYGILMNKLYLTLKISWSWKGKAPTCVFSCKIQTLPIYDTRLS